MPSTAGWEKSISLCRKAGWAAITVLVLAGCAGASIYRPKGMADGIGYSEQSLAPMRYRVTFSGTRDTPRVQVEDYLMRRAAELTVQTGFSHFAFESRSTEADSQYYVSHDNWNPNTGLGFGLGRRYADRAEYFSSWSFPTAWNSDKAALLTRYTASSNILILTPEQATKIPIALSARDILARLAPQRSDRTAAGADTATPNP